MPKKYVELHEDLAQRVGEARLKQARQAADEEVEQYKRTLRQLRVALDLTQTELAYRLETSQAEVSRLERRDDMLLSTLSRYVAAVGGRLEVNAVFEDRDVVVPLHTGARVGPIADPAPGALERLSETLNTIIDGNVIENDPRHKRSARTACRTTSFAIETFAKGSLSRRTTAKPTKDVDLLVEFKDCGKSSAETLAQIRTYLKAFEAYPSATPDVLVFAPILAAIPARQPLPIYAHAVRLAKAWRNATTDSTAMTWSGIAIPTAMRVGDDDHAVEIDWRSHQDPDETFTATLDDVELLSCGED